MVFIRDMPGLNSIKFGHIYLKPKDIEETITRCCRMVLHEADDPSFPLGRSGSATLVKYRSTNYVIATRHQLNISSGNEPSKEIFKTIRISSGLSQLANIMLKICRYETSNPDQEYHDLLVFEVADTWDTKIADAPYFFPLFPFSHAARRKSFLVGYPTVDGVMNEYLESFGSGKIGQIHIKRAITDCNIDHDFATHAEHVRRYLHSKPRSHVDGYSGGAVFSLVGELGNFEIILDGIVVRAGTQHIYTVDVDYLMKVIAGPSTL